MTSFVSYDQYALRPIQESDLLQILEWRNSEHIRNHMFNDQMITMSEHKAWFERVKEHPHQVHLIFEFQNVPVGVVNFTQINERYQTCDWGFYLGAPNNPRGLGTIMGFLGLAYIFEQKGIRKVCGQILQFNEKSIKFHQRLGFQKEGHLVKHVWKNGNYEDIVLMALFQDQWLKGKAQLEQRCFGGIQDDERNRN